MDETILVQQLGHLLEFSYTDMLCYAGLHSRHGVAGAFNAMHSGHSRAVPQPAAAATIGRHPRRILRARIPGRFRGGHRRPVHHRADPGPTHSRTAAVGRRVPGFGRRPHGDAAYMPRLHHSRVLRTRRPGRTRSCRRGAPRRDEGLVGPAATRGICRRCL
jgi:hypothetical protein